MKTKTTSTTSKAYLLVVLIIILALAGGAGYCYFHTADCGKAEIVPKSDTVSVKKPVAKEVVRPVEQKRHLLDEGPVGYFSLTIKPGTNVVENLPFFTKSLPTLEQLDWARPGDTVCWSNNTTTFDGKNWSGGFPAKTALPVHEKVVIIRTCNETSSWRPGGCVDPEK